MARRRARRNVSVVADDLWVCVDCIMFIANGDLPDDERAARAVVKGVEREYPNHWVAGDGEQTFSWSACDCCGSKLGGSRHEAALLGG